MKSALHYLPTDQTYSFYAAAETDTVGWRGFRPRGTLRSNSLSLGEAWNNMGIFVFAAAEPNYDDLNEAIKLLGDQHDETWLLWLHPDGSIQRPFVRLKPIQLSDYLTAMDYNVSLGNSIWLSINGNTAVKYNSGKEQLEFIFNKEFKNIRFMEGRKDKPLIQSAAVLLPFGGKDGGTFRFTVKIASEELNNKLNLGLKYFYLKKGHPVPTATEQFYPVFEPTPGLKLIFHVSLDPTDPYNREFARLPHAGLRSYLAFDRTEESIIPRLPSHFRTSFGHKITLLPQLEFDEQSISEEPRPLAGSALLVFSSDYNQEAYTIPQGHFYLSIEHAVPSANLLCGTTGTETVIFNPAFGTYAGDRMLFVPGCAAFWPADPAHSGELLSVPELGNSASTAWISIRPSESRLPESPPIVYSSQPEEEPHYRPLVDGVSRFHEPKLYDWMEEAHSVPLVPFQGIQRENDAAMKSALNFERFAIAPNRKRYMDRFSESARAARTADSSSENGWSATPQGLLVSESAGSWDTLVLGQNDRNPDSSTLGPERERLEFLGLSNAFRNTMLSSRLFLVMSINSKTHWSQFNNKISISDWPFQINIPESLPGDPENRDNRNIVIMKYAPGKLADWLKQPALWGNPEQFNKQQLDKLSQALVSYCRVDEEEDQLPPELIPFHRLCNKPDWTGILALNVDIRKEDMPKELIGLLGGINPLKPFRAHHIGLNGGRVEWKADGLSMDKLSSWFGFIHYQDDANVWGSQPFGFRVTELKARFENSNIETFESKMQLLIRKLYETEIVIEDANQDPVVTLTGSIERHEGIPSYVFQTDSATIAKMKGNHPILEAIKMIKVSFQTTDATDIKNIKSRFSVWGWKSFIEKLIGPIHNMDILGYGEGDNGLLFNNLGITMEFSVSDPFTPPTFDLDPFHIEFDPDKSAQRIHSLADHFPLRLRKLMVAKNIDEWKQAGYMEIKLDGVGDSHHDDNWYGLEYAINLGTLGKLVPEGALVGSFLIGWNAYEEVYCGIKIPGVDPSRRTMVLQEMLNLVMPNAFKLSVNKNSIYCIVTEASVNLFGKKYDFNLGFYEDPQNKKRLGWYTTTNI
ncbi:hypothetical protein V3851_07125 [Paenibacillus sp. M1]|uniref:Uncharacterized protein n=1 Tax=Paenibacillus haidiansis TaxID=1574488 RepID=A0ABU7VPD8_9BACL